MPNLSLVAKGFNLGKNLGTLVRNMFDSKEKSTNITPENVQANFAMILATGILGSLFALYSWVMIRLGFADKVKDKQKYFQNGLSITLDYVARVGKDLAPGIDIAWYIFAIPFLVIGGTIAYTAVPSRFDLEIFKSRNVKNGFKIATTIFSLLFTAVGSLIANFGGVVKTAVLGAGLFVSGILGITFLPRLINYFKNKGDDYFGGRVLIGMDRGVTIGAGIGAVVGSIFPVVGTVIGAAVGAVVGAAVIAPLCVVFKPVFKYLLGDQFTFPAKIGGAIGGAVGGLAGTFLLPGIGTALGVTIGTFVGSLAAVVGVKIYKSIKSIITGGSAAVAVKTPEIKQDEAEKTKHENENKAKAANTKAIRDQFKLGIGIGTFVGGALGMIFAGPLGAAVGAGIGLLFGVAVVAGYRLYRHLHQEKETPKTQQPTAIAQKTEAVVATETPDVTLQPAPKQAADGEKISLTTQKIGECLEANAMKPAPPTPPVADTPNKLPIVKDGVVIVRSKPINIPIPKGRQPRFYVEPSAVTPDTEGENVRIGLASMDVSEADNRVALKA